MRTEGTGHFATTSNVMTGTSITTGTGTALGGITGFLSENAILFGLGISFVSLVATVVFNYLRWKDNQRTLALQEEVVRDRIRQELKDEGDKSHVVSSE